MPDEVLGKASTVLCAIHWASAILDRRYTGYGRLHAEILLCSILCWQKIDLYTESSHLLSQAEIERFSGYVARNCEGEPVQYIIGYTEFFSLRFEVNRSVLIPRPETEVLVAEAQAWLSKQPVGNDVVSRKEGRPRSDKVIADIGIGAGTVGLTLASLNRGIHVWGVDTSPGALAVAGQNARSLSVLDQITLVLGSCCAPFMPSGREPAFDLIVSNPPYIRTPDLTHLPVGIRDFEPVVALDGGEDGLTWYRKLVDEAPICLRRGGQLMFEIGYSQASDVVRLMGTGGHFSRMRVLKDLNGLDRIVTGTRI